MASAIARSEKDVFADLENLCTSPGYVHAIAHLSFRDNYIKYNDLLTASVLFDHHTPQRLIRTEFSVLIGLMLKAPIYFAIPAIDLLHDYIVKTELLLAELHTCLTRPWNESPSDSSGPRPDFDRFQSAAAYREPIFYAAESAYSFQYLDLAACKYAKDDAWLEENRGFYISDLIRVAAAIDKLLLIQLKPGLAAVRSRPPESWTALPLFE